MVWEFCLIFRSLKFAEFLLKWILALQHSKIKSLSRYLDFEISCVLS